MAKNRKEVTYIELVKRGWKEKRTDLDIRKEMVALKNERLKWLNQQLKIGFFPKENIQESIKDELRGFNRGRRLLNPTLESTKDIKKVKLPAYYETWKQRDRWINGVKVGFVDVKRRKLTDKEILKLENKKTDLLKNIKRVNARFRYYDKKINWNKVTFDYKGEKMTAKELLTLYNKTSDRYVRSSITSSFKRGFKNIKNIKPEVIKKTTIKILNIDAGKKPNKKNIIINLGVSREIKEFTTKDSSQWVFGWDIDWSQQAVTGGRLLVRGVRELVINEHIDQILAYAPEIDVSFALGFLSEHLNKSKVSGWN